MFLSKIAIQRPVATIMFYLGVVILGIISLSRLPVDLLPDLSYPKLTIMTTYADVPPVEVEELVTVRIEEALGTVPRVRKLNSISKEGISLVMIEFLWGTDMDIAALNVREKLDNLRWSLPEGAGRPTIMRLDPRSQPIMALAVTGGTLFELKELTQNVFKRRLEQIDGVALSTVTGGFIREIQVEIDKMRLTALGLSVSQVSNSLANANRNLPGGTIKKGRYRFSIRTLGEFENIKEINDVVIAHHNNGAVITLGDIATVVDGFKERESITRFNGHESIGVIITKEAGSNTVEVAQKVQDVLSQLRAEYPEVTINVATNQAKFISESISNVLQAVLLGGILAFLILFLFLHDLRNPFNIAAAIPIAILATFALMYFNDVSLNMISLGGLALGVGMLVDNSIVVLENIFRHRLEGKDHLTAGFIGASEVAMPVTASTLTTIAVFFPIVYVKGVAGQLFRDQSLTVTFALLASLMVSLTLLPMLASRFFHRNKRSTKQEKEELSKSRVFQSLFASKKKDRSKKPSKGISSILRPLIWLENLIIKIVRWLTAWAKELLSFWFAGIAALINKLTEPLFRTFDRGFDRFMQYYEKLLQSALNHRKKVMVITLAGLLVSVLIGLQLEQRLMPKVDQHQFSLKVKMPSGTSLEKTEEEIDKIEKQLLKYPDVVSVFTQVGLASDQTTLLLEESSFNQGHIQVHLKNDGSGTEEFVSTFMAGLAPSPEREIVLETGTTILSQFLGTSESDVAIKINGNDLTYSLQLLNEIKEKIASVKGLTNLNTTYEEGRPEIKISINREMTGRYGISARQVADYVREHIYGSVSTQYKDFDRKIDILIRPLANQRDELEDLLQSQITTNNIRVPVRQLIHTDFSQGPTEIRREGQVRQLILYGNIQGRGFNDVIKDIETHISKLEYPYDYQVKIGGQREEMQRSFKSLIMVFVLAVSLVYMILAAQFESLLHPFVIMFAVPLALIGVVFTLFITGHSFNIMSLIGIVVLVGIVVNDAIIKVDFINQGRKAGLNVRDAITEAGKKRLRPILMTTVTTVLGLLPMALGIGEGAELRSPLAIVVIGGLLSATFLTLVIVPVLYSLVDREKIEHR